MVTSKKLDSSDVIPQFRRVIVGLLLGASWAPAYLIVADTAGSIVPHAESESRRKIKPVAYNGRKILMAIRHAQQALLDR